MLCRHMLRRPCLVAHVVRRDAAVNRVAHVVLPFSLDRVCRACSRSDQFRNSGFALTLHCRRASRPRSPGAPSLPPVPPWCLAAHLGMAGRPAHFYDWGVFKCVGGIVFSVGRVGLGLIPGPCRLGGSRSRGSSRGSAAFSFPWASGCVTFGGGTPPRQVLQAFDELMQACVSRFRFSAFNVCILATDCHIGLSWENSMRCLF